MPDPSRLKIGDYVSFVNLPEEWNAQDCNVHDESIEFMKTLVASQLSLQVYRIDQYGTPWVKIVSNLNGTEEFHDWAITEKSGWEIPGAEA